MAATLVRKRLDISAGSPLVADAAQGTSLTRMPLPSGGRLAPFEDEAADADGCFWGRCARCDPVCIIYTHVDWGEDACLTSSGSRLPTPEAWSPEACDMSMYPGEWRLRENVMHLTNLRGGAQASGFRSLDWGSGLGVCASCVPHWSESQLAGFVAEKKAQLRTDVSASWRAQLLVWRAEQRAFFAAEEAQWEGTTVEALAAAGRLEGLLPPFLRGDFRRELCGVRDA